MFKKKQIEELAEIKSIQEILNRAYQILGNPMAIFDTSYNLLCATENIVTDDPLWNELTTTGVFSHESVNFFNKAKFIEYYAVSETISFMKHENLKYDRINGKLFDNDNIQVANLIVIACKKPFEKDDDMLIQQLCEILSVALQNSELYSKIESVYQNSPLNRLIDGTLYGAAAKNFLASLYDGLKTNIYLAVADISRYDPTITHLAYFRDVFKKLQPEYKYFVHLNDVIMIFSTDKDVLSIKKDLAALECFFEKNDIIAGVSSGFQDLHEIRKHYREAINGLNYGLKSTRRQQFYFYDNIRIERFLNHDEQTCFKEIISPVVNAIKKHDEDNGSDLLQILYNYLLYGNNILVASQAAGIPTEQFNQALTLLQNEFEIDLTDGNQLSNIFISTKLLINFS